MTGKIFANVLGWVGRVCSTRTECHYRMSKTTQQTEPEPRPVSVKIDAIDVVGENGSNSTWIHHGDVVRVRFRVIDLINGSELDLDGRLVINGSAVANGHGMIEWENDRWLGYYTFGVEAGDGRKYAINSSTWMVDAWERGKVETCGGRVLFMHRVSVRVRLEDGRILRPVLLTGGARVGGETHR